MQMKKFILFAVVALVVAVGTDAYAEMKNVEVGGSVRVRWDRLDPLMFDDDNPGDDFASSTIRLNVGAELTEGVSAFIELQEIDIWGDLDDMRVGFPGPSYGYWGYDIYGEMSQTSLVGVPPSLYDEDGFSLYQGYILIEDVGGLEGISLKIGRQELAYGTEFILGNNDFGPGLSYDAVAAIWAQEDVRVDLFAAKLAEGRTRWGSEDDADVDLYGIYSSYLGLEDIVVDSYFVFLRGADIRYDWPGQLPVPEVPSSDDDPLQLYTIGGRIGGMYDWVDYNLEGAFQWGDNGWGGDYDAWALDAGIGYTFDVDMNPRIGFNYTFSSGDDDENDDDIETFLAPFSDNYHRYGYMDLFGLGNLNVFKWSATIEPTEKIGVGLHALHFLAVEHEDRIAPFSFWAGGPNTGEEAHSDTIGTELDLVTDYAYSEDLSFELAFAYFWPGPYIRQVFDARDDVYRIYLQAKLDF